MHSLSPNRRLHRHRSWRRKDPPLVRPEFTIQFFKFICRSCDQNWRFKLTLILLQEKLHSQKRVHIFYPALASQCCEHFVFYSRRWVVLWVFTLFHCFLCFKCVLESPSEKTRLLLSLQALICWVEALSQCLSSGSMGQTTEKGSCRVSEDLYYIYQHPLMASCFAPLIQTTVSLFFVVNLGFHYKIKLK